MLDFLRKGDVLMVTRIDRLARSIGDLQDIVRTVKARGASLKATEQPIDTSTAAGKCFLDMLGMFAEVRETYVANISLRALREQRWKACTRGASIDVAKVRAMKVKAIGAAEIAKTLGIGRVSACWKPANEGGADDVPAPCSEGRVDNIQSDWMRELRESPSAIVIGRSPREGRLSL